MKFTSNFINDDKSLEIFILFFHFAKRSGLNVGWGFNNHMGIRYADEVFSSWIITPSGRNVMYFFNKPKYQLEFSDVDTISVGVPKFIQSQSDDGLHEILSILKSGGKLS